MRVGTLIARPEGPIGACVHASVSGSVIAIAERPDATGGRETRIDIRNDGLYEEERLAPLADPTPDEIRQRAYDAGIVGMGGAGFPTHVKLAPKTKPDFFLINCAECEPYITCDHRLALEHAAEVVRGAELLRQAAGAERAVIGIEANKKDAYLALAAACEGLPSVDVTLLRVKYPQGAEKQLVFALTGRRVPPGGLPADVGCVVDNAHTAYSTARAVDCGEPLTSRLLTVSGGETGEPGNFRVLVGTPYSFVRECTRGGKDDEDLVKVLSGGPMMGVAQPDLSACVSKTTSALLFFGAKEAAAHEPTQCINCGRCIRQCPMKLSPRDIERAVLAGSFARTEELFVSSCMECGVCSFVCPAKRPLVQAIRLAKKSLKEGRK